MTTKFDISDEEYSEQSDIEESSNSCLGVFGGVRGFALTGLLGAVAGIGIVVWQSQSGGLGMFESTSSERSQAQVESPVQQQEQMAFPAMREDGAEGAEGAAPGLSSTLAPLVAAAEEAQDHDTSCGVNEEMLGGLCYKKCSLLTDGEFPLRWAPNACHRLANSTSGMPAETKFNGIVCNGFDVGDDRSCPHPPLAGECDENEELYVGKCYMKCEVLTQGSHKIRLGPNTCCQAWPCLNPFHDETEGWGCHGFGVGGGMYGHDCPHEPASQGTVAV